MADVDLIIQVHTDGVKKVTDLSASLRQLNTSLNGVFVPMSKMDSATRALNKALGMGSRGAKEHATSLKGLVQNQKVLGTEIRKITGDIKAMNSIMRKSGETKLVNPQTIASLQKMQTTLKNMKLRAFSSDIQSIGLRLTKIGKDAQFVGRSLMINLTAPITMFARYGLAALRDIDKEAVRLTKVLDNVAMSTEQAMAKTGQSADSALVKELVENYNNLNKALTQTSTTYGIAKSLTVGIAADYAELGISASSSISAITDLTAATEKLGGMDISASQDLIQSMYFQTVRAFDQAGRAFENAAAKEAAAIKAATAQLQLFNAIENTTALTMRDIGDAFPEVASMATTFGLSMTEAAAMLAPMKAAGLNVGASANAIKVSLQRAVAPTKQNVELLASLSKSYASVTKDSKAFENAQKSGLTGLLGVVESFTAVKNSAAGMEGTMQLMSKIFGVRQGPRMQIAIQQLALFNEQLTKTNAYGPTTEKQLADIANKASGSAKLMIENFADIGVVARVATAQIGQEVEMFGTVTGKDIKDANAARRAVAMEILKANREGRDLMSEISTEAGRAMIVELAGSASASVIAQRELDASLKSLDVTLGRIKNNFKLFAADLINGMRPALEKIAEVTTKLIDKWNSLSEGTKKSISVAILSVAGLLAALGPLILAYGTLSSVTGIVSKGIFKLIPGLKGVNGGFIGVAEGIKKATDRFDNFDSVYRRFLNRNLPDVLSFGGAAGAGGTGGAGFKALSASSGATSVPFPKLATSTAPVPKPFPTGNLFTQRLPGGGAGPAEFVKNRADLDKLVKLEQRKMLSAMGFDQKDIGIARGTVRGAGGRFLPATAGSRAVSAAMRPGGGADFGAAETALFARLEAARAASHAKDVAAEQQLHAQKLANIATENAAKMQAYNAQVAQQKIFDADRLALDAKRQANAARTNIFKDAGMTSRLGKDASGKAFVQRMFGGRDISDAQAAKLAKGGFGARLAKLSIGREVLGEKTGGLKPSMLIPTKTNVKDLFGRAKEGVTGAPGRIQATAPMKAAAQSVTDLKAKFNAIDGSAPKTFQKISAAVKGFASQSGMATKALKLMKFAFAGLGIGIVLAGIAVLVISVMRNFESFQKTGQKGLYAVKRVLKILKDTLLELIRPVLDLFGAFGSGSESGANAAEGIGKAFTFLMNIVQKVASFIKSIVVKVIQPALYFIVNIVAGVVALFQGEWGKLAGYLVAAIGWALKLVINIVIAGMKGFVSLFGLGVKAVLTYFTLIPKAVAKIFTFLGKIPGIGGMFKTVGNGINTVVDGMFGLVDAGTGAVNGALDAAGKWANKGLDKLTSKGIGKSVGNALTGAKKDAKAGGTAIGETANEAIANATGEGLGESVADKVAGAYKDAKKELAQKLVDYVMGEFENALKKFTKSAEDAMQKQKDAALAVYDQQVATLDKLAKAEESLTKTKEYELQRRQMLDERALQQQNYVRNRALAIYEGRIDDARMLELEDRKNAMDSTKSIAELDSSRKKDLAAENLGALKDAISLAKDEADKFFDETIKKFQDATGAITKFPPVTVDDYRKQLEQLTELARTTATDANTEFGKMFDDFATTVNTKMPNAGIPAFSTNMDELVKVAVDRYGLGKGTADNSTVIGSTIGMLMDMGAVMGENKQYVVDKFGTITTGMKDNVVAANKEITTSIYTKFVEDFNKAVTDADPTEVFKKAIADGNKSIIDDFRKTVGGVGSEVDNMIDKLDPLILKWAALEAQAKAAGEAQKDAAAGGGGGTPTGMTGTPKNAPKNYYGSVDTYLARVALQKSIALTTTGTRKYNGGMIPRFAVGGLLKGAMSQSIPALLHGGEYIVNAKAVQNIGAATLQNLNNMRFNAPGRMNPSGVSNVHMSTQNTNIYVDNFIGEEAWFESMMKEYNVNVLPKNQKAAGVQSRVVRSYNGINQGY